MESCARVIEMLPEYVEEELPRETSARIGVHLLSCGACRRRVEGHRRTLEALESLPQVIPPPDLRLAVMQQVRDHPLPAARGTRGHLRLVRAFCWTALLVLAGTASSAGALLLAGASWGRTSLTDPILLTEWLVALGQMAFSFLLNMATRTGAPLLLPSYPSFLAWQGGLGWMLATVAMCLVMGFGILATARAVFRPRSR